jgi:L-cysteine:1D-myo-inositol 2-amino-2-deoxy-alpha-D-glucopyranoside ligase
VLQLYDSLSQSKKPVTADGGELGIYVCGVTPYDVTHAGHAFLYQAFDVLRRYLGYKGYRVKHVQNLTDIDDDMVKQSRKTGVPVFELGLANDALFLADMRALNILPPDLYPRASEYVEKMVEIVARLLERGHAYKEPDGNVYFDVSTFPDYGQMAHEGPDLLAKRPDIPLAGGGRAPLDFLLWQRVAPADDEAYPPEPCWDSPWGSGRPGWHIECSAMCLALLGGHVSIHGGGADLMFPHHESEIAQSESYTGRKPFVSNWLHAGMLRYEGEKMSKSLGNLVLVRHLLTRYPAEAIRLYFASIHYRASAEFSEAGVAEWASIYRDHLLPALGQRDGTDESLDTAGFAERFEAAMDDDLDTPTALAVLVDLAVATVNHGSRRGQSELARLCALFGLETG